MTDYNLLSDLYILNSIEPTLTEKIIDDYIALIEDSDQIYKLYRNIGNKDVYNRDTMEYQLLQTGKGYFVLKGIITEFGKGLLEQVQQSYLLTNENLQVRDRIEYLNLTYEISKILSIGNIVQGFLIEVERGRQ